MESKKNIGKLFRENLEQLDYVPSVKVWEQIELDLEKKKKKRRFFIWFFFSSLIISSLIGGIGYTFYAGNSISNKRVVKENSILNEKTKENNTTVVINENNSDENSVNSSVKSNSDTTNERKKSTRNNEHKNDNLSLKENHQKYTKTKLKSNLTNQTIANKKKIKAKKDRISLSNNSLEKSYKKSNKVIPVIEKTIATTIILDSENKTDILKNNTFEEITKRTPIDSLVAATTNKKIEKKDKKAKDSLAIKDSIAENKEKSKDYEIIIAPYYGLNYNGFIGDFDAISNNTILEKKGEMRASFGVLARWMFDNKLGFQIGLGKINSRYFSTVEKVNSSFVNTQNVSTELPIGELNGIFANATKVKFTYESTYIEVPLEAYYVVRDKKIGVATSLGVSLLFAGENSVFAESEGIEKLKIGSLTTNPSSGATANAKVYLFYKITPKLQLDLYPSFQYQIMGNTDSSNYSSYFFSIKTGLSYKL